MCFTSAHYAKTFGEERARAAEATPEMRQELIRQYLLKHPPPNDRMSFALRPAVRGGGCFGNPFHFELAQHAILQRTYCRLLR